MKNPGTNRRDHTTHTGMRAHDTTRQGDEVCMSGTKMYTHTQTRRRDNNCVYMGPGILFRNKKQEIGKSVGHNKHAVSEIIHSFTTPWSLVNTI